MGYGLVEAGQELAQAISLHMAERLDEAGAIYMQLLAQQPENPDLLFLLGTLRVQQGALHDAQAALSNLLRVHPRHVDGWAQLAEVYRSMGQIAEALHCYRQVLLLAPENVAARTGEAACLDELLASAQQAMQAALDAYQQRDFPAAIQWATESLNRFPSAVAWNNLGVVYKEQGNLPEAENALRQAISLAPDYAEAWSNLGNVYWVQYRYADALDPYERAVKLQPNNPVSWNNLGNGLQAVGCLDEAVEAFERVLQLQPDFAMAHWNHGIAALLKGDYRTGWDEYEWGFACGLRPLKFQSVPVWQGESGARLIVYAEQGFGDVLQFVRFMHVLPAKVTRLALVVPVELQRLLQRSFPAVQVATESGVNTQEYTAVLPLMSVPHRLGLVETADLTIPAPYLKVDQAKATRWRERISGNAGMQIGIAWQGSRKHKSDLLRSVPAEQLVQALAGGSVSLHSLQAGPDAPEAPQNVTDWRAEIQDFDDLAAIVNELDCVVTVDTAVAHLAGALGKHVYLLLPFAPDWRWGRYSESCVWYDRMHLIRQPSPGEWDAVMQRLEDALIKK